MIRFFLTLIFILILGNALCQPGDPPEPVPLDGGLLWLLLAGAGYGVKKIVDHRKKKG